MSDSWRFFATRLDGDGGESVIAEELPLGEASVERVISGAGTIRGTITPEYANLRTPTGPLLVPWSTAVYAELDGQIIGGGIMQPGSEAMGSRLQIDCAGFSHYAHEMPYDGEIYFVEKDALDIYRHIWEHLQSQPGGNIGLVLDSTKAGVLVGEELEEVEFETGSGDMVAFEAGPFKLAWWLTDNLAERLDDLSELAEFEFLEQHSWNTDGGINHRLRFGVPKLGRRRSDLHFMAGDNLIQPPVFAGTDYASEMWVLGAGEGRAMKHGRASRSRPSRLRRVGVVADKTMMSKARAEQLAGQILGERTGEAVATSVVIRRDSGVPDLGDEVQLMTTDIGWEGQDEQWLRVIGVTHTPGSRNVTCEVVRA